MVRNTSCMAGAWPIICGITAPVGLDLPPVMRGPGARRATPAPRPHPRRRAWAGTRTRRPVGGHGAVEIGVGGDDDHRQREAVASIRRSSSMPSMPGMRTSVTTHIGLFIARARRERLRRARSCASHAGGFQRLVEHPAHGRIVVDDPDGERLAVHAWPSAARLLTAIGRRSMNTVLPGCERYSIRPPWRLRISCASGRPRPVPVWRPGDQRIENGVAEFRRAHPDRRPRSRCWRRPCGAGCR